LNLWHYPDRRGWNELLACEKIEVLNGDPYSEQLHHFAGIVRGEEQPIVSGLDATRNIAGDTGNPPRCEIGDKNYPRIVPTILGTFGAGTAAT
jgi:hypothetical protein